MKTRLLSLAAFAFAITSSFGQLVLHEPFNYVVGQTLTGQTLGTSTWVNFSGGTPDDMLIADEPQWSTYPGLPSTSTGKAVAWQGGGSDLSLPFAEINSGTVYYSFLINIIDWAGNTPDAYRLVSLSIPSSSNVGPSFYTKAGSAPDTFNIGYAPADVASEAVYVSTDYAYGSQFFIVISYEIGSSMGKMWVNPVSSATPPTPNVSTDVTTKPRSAFDDLQLQASSNARTPSTIIDEIRIGKSWADVVSQTASVSSFELNNVKLYPNPVKNNLFISSNEINFDAVSIYTIDGKKVLNQHKIIDNTIDVSSLTSGMYVVKLNSTDSDAVLTRKIIIE